MKKVIVGLVLGAVLLVNSAFANNNNENVTEKVKAAFRQEFVQASEVSWFKADSYYKATFKLNDDILVAYFTEEGQMIGVTRNLVSTELPINLQTSLKKDYSGFWITELFEFAQEGQSNYFITVENADQKLTLQSSDGSTWTVFRKAKK